MYRMTAVPIGYAYEYRRGVGIVGCQLAILEAQRGDLAYRGLVAQFQGTGTCRVGVLLSEVGVTGYAGHTEFAGEEVACGEDAEGALALKQGAGIIAALFRIGGAECLREGVVAVAPEGLFGRGVGIVYRRPRRAVAYILAPCLHVAVGNHVACGSLEGRRRDLLAVRRHAALVTLSGKHARSAVHLPKTLGVACAPFGGYGAGVESVAGIGDGGGMPRLLSLAAVLYGHLPAVGYLGREGRGVEPCVGIIVIDDSGLRPRDVEFEGLARRLIGGVGHRQLEVVVRVALVAVVQLLDERDEGRYVERQLRGSRHVGADGKPEILQCGGHVVVRRRRKFHLCGQTYGPEQLVGQKRRRDLYREGLYACFGRDVDLDGHGIARYFVHLGDVEPFERNGRSGGRGRTVVAARHERRGCQDRSRHDEEMFHVDDVLLVAHIELRCISVAKVSPAATVSKSFQRTPE